MKRGALERAFHEVHENTPRIVSHTREKFGPQRAERQRVAIALNKARKGYAFGGPVMPFGSSKIPANVRNMAGPAFGGSKTLLPGGGGFAAPRTPTLPPVVQRMQAALADRAAHGGAGPGNQPPNAGVIRGTPPMPGARIAGGAVTPSTMRTPPPTPGVLPQQPPKVPAASTIMPGGPFKFLADSLAGRQAPPKQHAVGPPMAGIRPGVPAVEPSMQPFRPGAVNEFGGGQLSPAMIAALKAQIASKPQLNMQDLLAGRGGPSFDLTQRAGMGMAEGGPVVGGAGLIAKRRAYNQYVIEEQEQGNAPLSFTEWMQQTEGSPVAGELPGTAQPQDPGQREPIIDVIMNKLRGLRFQAGGHVPQMDEDLIDPTYYESDMIPPEVARMAAEMRMEGGGEFGQGSWPGRPTEESRARRNLLLRLIRSLQGGAKVNMGDLPPVSSRQEIIDRYKGNAAGGRVRAYSSGGKVHHIDPREYGGFTHESPTGMLTYAGGGGVRYAGGGQVADVIRMLMHKLSQTTDPLKIESLQRQIRDAKALGTMTGARGYQEGGPVMPGAPEPGMQPPGPPMAGPMGPPPGGPEGPGGGMPGMPGGAQPGVPGAPGAFGAVAAPPNVDPVDHSIGALAQLGQQLLKERAALQGAWQIPPPIEQGPPGGAPSGGGMPGPSMPPGAPPAGPPPGGGAVQEGLRDRLTPSFARGGPVNSRVISMAARDPRLAAKMCACGGRV